MKYLISFIVLLLNLINVPLTILFMNVQKWYLPMWKKDKIIYFAFAPFYWILVVLTFIFGHAVDKLSRTL